MKSPLMTHILTAVLTLIVAAPSAYIAITKATNDLVHRMDGVERRMIRIDALISAVQANQIELAKRSVWFEDVRQDIAENKAHIGKTVTKQHVRDLEDRLQKQIDKNTVMCSEK